VTHLGEGRQVGDPATAHQFVSQGTALASALLLGIAEALTEQATAHAKTREQFGRPIGAFQAVKHLLADMVVRTEVARAAVHSAGVHLDGRASGDGEAAVRTAKILAGESALLNGKSAVQVHGGMGFTWEVPVHLYLKRAAVLAQSFGSADAHAEALASAL
jgi:alkylation response protein AidB-like acyl-CoA dehydrogenase